jgi:hypothetical protein
LRISWSLLLPALTPNSYEAPGRQGVDDPQELGGGASSG